jgi:hypothetical protein
LPEVSRFYGIVIRMFYRDHNPPHFHAEYGSETAVVEIATLAVIEGRLPARALGLVVEWATIHQEELLARWNSARQHEPLEGIEPLP